MFSVSNFFKSVFHTLLLPTITADALWLDQSYATPLSLSGGHALGCSGLKAAFSGESKSLLRWTLSLQMPHGLPLARASCRGASALSAVVSVSRSGLLILSHIPAEGLQPGLRLREHTEADSTPSVSHNERGVLGPRRGNG